MQTSLGILLDFFERSLIRVPYRFQGVPRFGARKVLVRHRFFLLSPSHLKDHPKTAGQGGERIQVRSKCWSEHLFRNPKLKKGPSLFSERRMTLPVPSLSRA